jgi:hypothetical protein
MPSKRVVTATATASLAVVVLGLSQGTGTGRAQQPGVAETIGEKLDSVGRGIVRGAQDLSDSVRQRFEVVRSEVSRMGVQPRVYSRLHWDKTLSTARIEVHMLRDGVVLLRGVVPDAAAKAHAVALARDTRDVTGVVDELETVIPAPAPTPATAPTPTSRTTNPPVLTVPSLTRPAR